MLLPLTMAKRSSHTCSHTRCAAPVAGLQSTRETHVMRALVCTALGDPTAPLGSGVLELREQPSAALKPKHIRIRVHAASLNFPDALQVQGQYQVKPPLPFTPGSEVSGIVSEVGPKANRFKAGDKVCAISMGGAFAEELVVPEVAAWAVPDGVELESAAAVPVVYGTADLALRHRANLRKGQTLLVLGAAGGVGVAACQIGRALGAKVVAVVNGQDKASFLQQMGVDAVVDASATQQPLSKAIKAVAPKGADVVFDPVGGAMFDEALKAAAPWGAKYLVVGFAAGTIPKVAANLLLVKNMTVHGIFWGSYLQHQPAVLVEGMNTILRWLAEGKLKVQVSHRFPLEQAPLAFQALLQRKVMGKALLLMRPASRL